MLGRAHVVGCRSPTPTRRFRASLQRRAKSRAAQDRIQECFCRDARGRGRATSEKGVGLFESRQATRA